MQALELRDQIILPQRAVIHQTTAPRRSCATEAESQDRFEPQEVNGSPAVVRHRTNI